MSSASKPQITSKPTKPKPKTQPKPKWLHDLIKEQFKGASDEAITDLLKKLIEESTVEEVTWEYGQNDCSSVLLEFKYVFVSEAYGRFWLNIDGWYQAQDPAEGVELIAKMRSTKPAVWEDESLIETIIEHATCD